jgi:hypothetical protein
MQIRLSILASCLAGLMLAGCGGGAYHVVERTVPAAAASQPPEPEAMKAEQPSPEAQVSSEQSIATLPQFPQSYRALVAVELALEYMRYGEGQPEITEVYKNAGLLGASTGVCVQFNFKQRYARHEAAVTRYQVFGSKTAFTLGKTVFKRDRHGHAGKCDRATKPFPELERVAQTVRSCAARGERRCVVATSATQRHVFVLPAKPN